MPSGHTPAAGLTALRCVFFAFSSAAAQGTATPSQYAVVCGHGCLQEFAERFLGKIRQIEATVHSVPYRMHPGWPAQ